MKNGSHESVNFPDTVPMALYELPSAAARPAPSRPLAPKAVALPAPRAAGKEEADGAARDVHWSARPLRRASDLGIGLIARFSLHRRRATDVQRAAAGRFVAPVSPVSPVSPPPSAIAEREAVQPALRLFVRGFSETETKLLEGTVRLSQRRLPRLALVAEADAANADLVLIDGQDADAVAWAEAKPWLAGKRTIWIDSRVPRPGHTEAYRPVQWPLLPMLLARALEQARGTQARSAVPAPVSGLAVLPSVQRVLVVDDSLAVRNHLRTLLETRGLHVTEASCVDDALSAVTATRFACALMDVLMPSTDGYEGCRRIKGLKSAIGVLPVIMLTSKSSPFDRIRGKMAGCDAYLTKPVEPASLFAALEPYLAPGSLQPTQSLAPYPRSRLVPSRHDRIARA